MRHHPLIARLFVCVMLALAALVILRPHPRDTRQLRPMRQTPAIEPGNSNKLPWTPATPEEMHEGKLLIQAQLKAIESDDFVTAVSFQFPSRKMPPDEFRRLIHTVYPQLCHNISVKFGKSTSTIIGHRMAQELIITSPRGKKCRSVYYLERITRTGPYRVQEIKVEQVYPDGIGWDRSATPKDAELLRHFDHALNLRHSPL